MDRSSVSGFRDPYKLEIPIHVYDFDGKLQGCSDSHTKLKNVNLLQKVNHWCSERALSHSAY